MTRKYFNLLTCLPVKYLNTCVIRERSIIPNTEDYKFYDSRFLPYPEFQIKSCYMHKNMVFFVKYNNRTTYQMPFMLKKWKMQNANHEFHDDDLDDQESKIWNFMYL